MAHTLSPRLAAGLVGIVGMMLAIAVIALHVPGQMSMDTSVQLYEAKTGVSISWNPPAMSALLRWFGGGRQATTIFVCLCTLLSYGAMAAISLMAVEARDDADGAYIASWRVGLALLLMLNPLIAIYSGIVWKDVLFAALLAAGAAFGTAAIVYRNKRRAVAALLCCAVLSFALLVRQQGIFMAPLLLLLPLSVLSWRARGLLVALFLCLSFLLSQMVGETIRNAEDRSSAVGLRSIMIFDIAGILAREPAVPEGLAEPVPPQVFDALHATYDAARIDTLGGAPSVQQWFRSIGPAGIRRVWGSLILHHPQSYLAHRATSYATLLGLRGIGKTLPVHVGIEGNPAYFAAVGLQEGRNSRSLLILEIASAVMGWPIYRHAFWLALAAAAAMALVYVELPPGLRRGAKIILSGVALMYISFLPTTIASDFRYLYAPILLTSLVLLVLLLCARRPAMRAGE